MKRALLAIVGTVAGLVALLSFKTHPSSVGAFPASGAAPSARRPSVRVPAGTHHRAAASAGHRSTTRRTVHGSAVDTGYGTIQVKVTLTGTRIDTVGFDQIQGNDPHSDQINAGAAPVLVAETVTAQSAHIDTVSGATYTSAGYKQSLQAALDKAGA